MPTAGAREFMDGLETIFVAGAVLWLYMLLEYF